MFLHPIRHRADNVPTLAVVVTSGPSSVWPRKAYRNPIEQLVGFLDKKHGADWAVFEFRAEGTGYPDEKVYGRVHHFPWPDHHPPPFRLIPNIMAGMRNWIQGEEVEVDDKTNTELKTAEKTGNKRRVAVVHCKAGKGRSGTASCSYLISEEGWKMEEALNRFTVRRMRTGFGQGVSIPSQLRYVRYVNRWTNEMKKKYVDRPVQVLEVHVWGLRDGVKVAVEGFVDDGKRIHNFHTFTRSEKTVVEEGKVTSKQAPVDAKEIRKDEELITSPVDGTSSTGSSGLHLPNKEFEAPVQTVVLRPEKELILPTSDINVDFERRNKASYAGFTMVTSMAHVWWNAWFEGGYEGHESGIFEIEWDAMDGIKGSVRKGIRAFDRLKVVWKYPDGHRGEGHEVKEPEKGEPVPEAEPADWKGESSDKEDEAGRSKGVDNNRPGGAMLTMGTMIAEGSSSLGRELGLRKSDPGSADVSVAGSVKDMDTDQNSKRLGKETDGVVDSDSESDIENVKPHGPEGEDHVTYDEQSHLEGKHDTATGRYLEMGLAKTANIISKWRGDDKPVGSPHAEGSGGSDIFKAQKDAEQVGAQNKDFAPIVDGDAPVSKGGTAS